MSWRLLLLFIGGYWMSLNSWAQTPAAAPPASVASGEKSPAERKKEIVSLHEAWLAEHDPAKRKELAEQLLFTVIHNYGEVPVDIADELSRDGLPKMVIVPLDSVQVRTLDPLFVLKGAQRKEWDYPESPVFRRISQNRVEAWTSKEGWLFDGRGRIVADVQVPRRDGTGREWFGAFLPDGRWITTDLWSNDEQLNGYEAKGKWLWELPGRDMVNRLPKPEANSILDDEPVVPSIGWARADKTGKRWLVGLGENFSRGYVLLDPERHIRALPYDAHLWNLVYPRAMGVRGMYTALFIESDDGKEVLLRSEAGHGVGVGWPDYNLSNRWGVTINEGNAFGFWPHSHDVYIDAARGEQRLPEVWFFDANGKYQGEMAGTYLADASNGKDILVRETDSSVIEVSNRRQGPVVQSVRRFKWPDGSEALPLAIYDDLKLGFFLRGNGMDGPDADDARRARAAAEIVLARW